MRIQRTNLRMAICAAAVASVAVVGGVLAIPSASAAATVSTTVDDAVTKGANHFAYTGSWSVCRGCRADAVGRSFHYTNRRGASVKITFSGVGAVVYGLKQPAGGIVAVTLDGRSRGSVNFAASKSGLGVVYSTPSLRRGTHTLTLTVTAKSTGRGHTVGVDKVVVSDLAPVTKPPAQQPPAQQPPAQQPPAQQPPGDPQVNQPPVQQPPAQLPPAKGSGIASLSFDDGQLGQFQNAAPALASAGVHGTFYVVSDAMGWGPPSMNAAQVKQLAAGGNEIGDHTRDHSHLPGLTNAQIEAEFADSVAALRNQVGVTPTTCAYPYGDVNSTVEAIAAKYFSACRGTGGGTNGSGGDSFNLRVFYIQDTTTAADVRAAADAAKAAGTWIIYVWHGVGSGPGSENVTTAQFVDQLAAVKASGIAIRTVSEALASR